MSLSGAEQQQVQMIVETASSEERRQLRAEAEGTLAEINVLMGQKLLSREESHAANIAVEVLVRIEALEQGKGVWFRTKRRVQLVQMYLGS